jgi:alpha-mannosidase
VRAGRAYGGLHYFEDVGDAGDEYAFAAPQQQELIESRDGTPKVEVRRGPTDQTLRVRQVLRLPDGLAPDGSRRNSRRVPCGISSTVRLFPGVRRVDIETTITNTARDHRLRVAFPTGAPTSASVADDTFQIARRSLALPDGADWEEPPVPTRPHRTFVAVEHAGHGLAVASVGLPEHEVTPEGVIYLTLLRCVGYLGRATGVPRKGLVGPSIETPGAQCLGEHRFRYAVIPFAGGFEDARIWRPAADLNTPMVAAQMKGSEGSLPGRLTLLGVDSAEIHLSAVKLGDDEDTLIVRVYNLTSRPVRGAIELFTPMRAVLEVNLNEEGGQQIALDGGHRFAIELGPHQIKTLKITR